MLKPLVSLLLIPVSAQAFDPHIALQGAGIAGRLFSGDFEDVADIGLSFTGLLEDLEIDSSADEELRRRIENLRDIESRIRKVEDVSFRTGNLTSELARATRLKDQLRIAREMVRVSKTIASMMGVRPKGAERALKVQNTRLNYMMLDELMALRRMQYEAALNEQVRGTNIKLLVADVKSEELKAKRSTR